MTQSPHRLRNGLKCVELDVKPYYTHTQNKVRRTRNMTVLWEIILFLYFVCIVIVFFSNSNKLAFQSKADQFAPVTLALTRWPWYANFTWILWRCITYQNLVNFWPPAHKYMEGIGRICLSVCAYVLSFICGLGAVPCADKACFN